MSSSTRARVLREVAESSETRPLPLVVALPLIPHLHNAARCLRAHSAGARRRLHSTVPSGRANAFKSKRLHRESLFFVPVERVPRRGRRQLLLLQKLHVRAAWLELLLQPPCNARDEGEAGE